MRHFISAAATLKDSDIKRDFANRNLQFVNLLADKLGDELVGRLSELAENKIGQLTFHFAARKLGLFVQQELAEGKHVLSEVSTTIDGQPAKVLACRQWGVIVLGDRLLALERYPLVSIDNLSTSPKSSET